MKKLVSPDRNKILTFISGQTDIADHIKSLWIGEWNDFCDLDSDKRDSYFPKLILNLLMFKDGLKICYPSIEELPKKLGDPQGKYKEELNEWIEKIEKVLDAYVCADSDLKSKILYQIIRYCAEYKPSKLQHLCALSVLSMYKAGGIS